MGANKSMRGVIVIIAIVCLLSACSTYTGKTTRWDYMTPEHVRCMDNELKFCRKYGPKMICECYS